MNLNSREIRRLNIKSCFNRRCCRCCSHCSIISATGAASVCLHFRLTICLFGCLNCVGAFVCCLSKYFFAFHLFVIVCTGDIRLLFKLLFKFRNVLKHTESRSSLTYNQNIKEGIPRALEAFLCFETKRHTCKQILHKNIHATRE